MMKPWIKDYLDRQTQAVQSIDPAGVAAWSEILVEAQVSGRRIFVFGNGGSAANASHFATDLGKSASDSLGKRFKVMSLTDNCSWLTAIGNDYRYEDIFLEQLRNYAEPGDVAFALSVSGNSPNTLKATSWARDQGLQTVALVGARRGRLASLAQHVMVIDSEHYGQVEDTQMTVCHLLCYLFVEQVVTVERTES